MYDVLSLVVWLARQCPLRLVLSKCRLLARLIDYSSISTCNSGISGPPCLDKMDGHVSFTMDFITKLPGYTPILNFSQSEIN